MRTQHGSTHDLSSGHRRWGVLLTGVLAVSLLLTACSSGSSGTGSSGAVAPAASPQAPARFQIALGIDPDSLDPAAITTTTVANMLDYMVEPLVKIDKDGKNIPGLAESWQIASDGLSITFKLRQGVKFHDGTAFNAQAVKYTFNRLLDPNVRVPQRAMYRAIKSVDPVDDYTVKFTLSAPSPALLGALSHTVSGMISPASIDKDGNSYTHYVHPVGTGPYTFKEYVKGSRLSFAKFSEYWGKKPYYDTVDLRIVPEAATRESLVLAGQADMLILPPTADIPNLQKNNKVNVLLAPSDRIIYIALNTTSPKLKDKRVRQALNYAVDREAIIKSVLFGLADPMDAPMASSLVGYAKQGSYPYDPAKAKQLLADAGVGNLELKFAAPTGRYVQDFQAAQAVAGYLEKVGVKATPATMDWPSYVATVNAPPDKATMDMHMLGWAPSFLDSQQAMEIYNSSNIPPKGQATAYLSNPKVDDLLAQASKELDPQKRNQDYADASKIVWDEAPLIFLWVQRFPIVHSSKVTGISYLPNEKFDAIYAQPAK